MEIRFKYHNFWTSERRHKINESRTIIESENNEQINLDEESDPENKNQYEQDRWLIWETEIKYDDQTGSRTETL